MTSVTPVPVEAARAILIDPDSSATALFCLVLRMYWDQYQVNLLETEEPPEPIEIWQDLEEIYGVRIPLENENRINALWLGLSGDGFFEEPEIFTAVCASLYDGDIGDPMDEIGDELGVEEILWGVYEVSLWRGVVEEFNPRIQRLIAEVNEQDRFEESEAVGIQSMVAGLSEDLLKLGIDREELEKFLTHHEMGTTSSAPDPGAQAGASGVFQSGGHAGYGSS